MQTKISMTSVTSTDDRSSPFDTMLGISLLSHNMVVPCQHRADTETGQFPMRFSSSVDSCGLRISNAQVVTFWFIKDWGSPVVYMETRVLEIAEVPELIHRYLVVHYCWWFISAFHSCCKSVFWCSLEREWECRLSLHRLQNTWIFSPCDINKMCRGELHTCDCS